VSRHAWCALLATAVACGAGGSQRHGRSVVFASGADLQSINPLVTLHPFAKQIERYVLLTTLARYDSALVAEPYLARSWRWSPDRRTLTLRLYRGLRWSDGQPTTARDVQWTLDAARDPATGYPRLEDVSAILRVSAPDDSTAVVRFAVPQPRFPDVFTDLAILPSHLLDTVPHDRLRRAAWNDRPVGNGPFRFVLHEVNRRWVFALNPDFPAALGGAAWLDRFVVVVVDEPAIKLAALVDGELDFAGIQPAHATFVRRDPDLVLLDYPTLLAYALVFNTREAPFAEERVRRAVSLSIDRQQLVDGYLFGFGIPAGGPVPPGIPGAVAPGPPSPRRDSAGRPVAGRRVAFELLTVGSGEAPLEQMLQAQLARAGFDVTIRQVELTAFLDRVYGAAPRFQAAVVGIQEDLGLGYLASVARVAGVGLASADRAALVRLFHDSVPAAFIYYARGLQGMNRRVQGVRMDLRGELPTLAAWRVAP
jgi:peptide/nickel transport system substrate-binding protein